MFKHTISELKEALVCLQAGQVTLPYPFQPHPVEENFRGKPVVLAEKCIGCGACANACPPRLISITDSDLYRQIRFELSRCTYCASCRDVCPEQAIEMSAAFETATPNIEDMTITLQLKLIRCRECGLVVATQRMIDRVQASLVEAHYSPSENVDLCIQCKRQQALKSPTWIKEVV